MPRAIFFDAAGTLIRLTKSVGAHYALVAQRQGHPVGEGSVEGKVQNDFGELGHGEDTITRARD